MEDAYLHPELKSCFRRYIRLLQFTSRELRKRQLRPYVSAEELAESGIARWLEGGDLRTGFLDRMFPWVEQCVRKDLANIGRWKQPRFAFGARKGEDPRVDPAVRRVADVTEEARSIRECVALFPFPANALVDLELFEGLSHRAAARHLGLLHARARETRSWAIGLLNEQLDGQNAREHSRASGEPPVASSPRNPETQTHWRLEG